MRAAFPIRTDADLERAIALVDELWNAVPGTAEADLLDVMASLIDRYEADRSELPPADPVELLKFKLAELGWTQRELGRRLGWSSGRVSEVLSRKRPLTLAMVRSLSHELGLAAGLLVHDHRDDEGNGWVAVPVDLGRRLATISSDRGGVQVHVIVSEALDRAFGTNILRFHRPERTSTVGAPILTGKAA